MPPAFHIFIKQGDAREEIGALLDELGPGSRSDKGLHKVLFVTRANQTVVFLDSPGSRLAELLRRSHGWAEPDSHASDA